jgi:hypothetical protein
METRTKTFEVDYNYIEPGTLVVAASTRAGLGFVDGRVYQVDGRVYQAVGRVYQVQECMEPRDLRGRALCRVLTHPEGQHQMSYVTVTSLRVVTVDELTEDQTRLREVA